MRFWGFAVVIWVTADAAFAESNGDLRPHDFSQWGSTGATPLPAPDRGAALCAVDARPGAWWWPRAEDGNSDMEVWGNRGVVFYLWKPQDKPVSKVKQPPIPPHPMVVDYRLLLNNPLFDENKAVLRPEVIAVIDQNIAALKEEPEYCVILEGHACDLGSPEYNLVLGLRRAETVKRYMVENGIDANRLAVTSVGESKPAVPNDSEANRKLNRSVHFDVVHSEIFRDAIERRQSTK